MVNFYSEVLGVFSYSPCKPSPFETSAQEHESGPGCENANDTEGQLWSRMALIYEWS